MLASLFEPCYLHLFAATSTASAPLLGSLLVHFFYGASIGIPFKQDGNTALINAIRADAFKVVEALIKGGASMLIIDEVSGYMA